MDDLLRRLIEASGVAGYESEVAKIIYDELKKVCDKVEIDNFGNVIGCKGKGRKKIMLASHMDEIGLVVKNITKDGFLTFIKVGGIDDRVLLGQRVIIKSKKGDFLGIIGARPPHLQKDEEKNKPIRYEDMFIDIGCKSKKEVENKVDIGSPIIFEPNFGQLNGNYYYGKAIDDRVGCFVLIKVMQKIKPNCEVYAVATTQEEVGLKGARTSSFKISPDYALVIDTNTAGDTPQVSERESTLRLGEGVGITIMEASGRGLIVNEKMKELLIKTAKKNKIKYQISIIEGGMTDGAIIYMNKEGIPTGVISIPTRYIHSASSVFNIEDVNSAIELITKVIKRLED
ncbi:MAG: M42 family metallopeptidase [Candidatus Aenigmatarchaeota archaeon]